ncbi:MAG TPA: hypothetical protein VHY36_12615 [Steroidobacteraceae bacterium]|nr:hypothetical protein [Steroidobacteraceae bacterium]
MSDGHHTAALRAAFRGAVTCSRTANALILSGAAADSADDRLILTFVSASMPDIPQSLSAASVHAVDGSHYRIVSGSGDLVVEATSLHVHRDIGRAFYRAVPPRRVPLKKRLFWRVVLWLAGSGAGKRVLSTLRRR